MTIFSNDNMKLAGAALLGVVLSGPVKKVAKKVIPSGKKKTNRRKKTTKRTNKRK